MTSNEIRRKFLKYFEDRGHRAVKSSSLVPVNDPTLLFTNAGMNQFKDTFLGLEQRPYNRAASAQKCVRAGGKHNDLENVGRTRRHLTFFEMLGNFSFGDYFKKEAIAYAWELVTKEFGLPPEKLYITVFGGGEIAPGQPIASDEEARLHWQNTGVESDRIFNGSVKDNFWAMGDIGPCGPCSEIHCDMGPEASEQGHTDCRFPCPGDCGRYVEIWNLVFMQFNRDAQGALTPLPKPSIDTGMGLERMASVMQGKLSVFETDLLFRLVQEGAGLAGAAYGEKAETDVSLYILADHSRAATFLIHDGVLPANDGRGYVLRKILRRAIRHGRILGLERPFLFEMVGKFAELMSDAYPELLDATERVAAVVKSEELRFAHTMTIAMREFDKVVEDSIQDSLPKRKIKIPGQETRRSEPITLPGERLFRLYDTFGMPLDWIQEMANERGFWVDEEGFNKQMKRQRDQARAHWKEKERSAVGLKKGYEALLEVLRRHSPETDFTQGELIRFDDKQTSSHDCLVLLLVQNSENVPEVPAGVDIELVLDHTPFYAEGGGQVGDTGYLLREGSDEVVATVLDTYRPAAGIIAHRVQTHAPIRMLYDRVNAVVDGERRRATMRNHTATHLLHAALRQVLGTHVKQEGSVVEPSRLRFDFAHFTPVEETELEEIERLANAEILRNTQVETNIMELDQAIETGAMAFFGEKYPDSVRVVSVPGFSKELCGGTHVSRTGDIGVLKITSESGISAGVRRIEAVTGTKALEEFQAVTSMVHDVAAALKTTPEELSAAIEKLTESERNLAKEVDSLKMKMAQAQTADLETRARTVKDVKVLSVRLDALDRAQMRSMADNLRSRLKSGVVVLGSASDGKVALIAAITQDLTSRLHAGKIAQAVAKKLGGTGGGRPDIAEAGGKNATVLDSVLDEVYEIVGEML